MKLVPYILSTTTILLTWESLVPVVVSGFTAIPTPLIQNDIGFQSRITPSNYHIANKSWKNLTFKKKATNTNQEEGTGSLNTATTATITANLRIPLSFEEMVNQASSAMEDAYRQGKTRQIVRVLLPRSASNDQLLQYYEDDVQDGSVETVLVPTDETWQGGIMQLYRAASYTCQAMLR